MATEETIKQVVNMLFQSPVANKPKPLPGQTEADVIRTTMRIYAITLQDIDDKLLMAATVNHLASEKWFPAVADIRTSALSLVNRADNTPSAYEAWLQVKKAVRYRDCGLDPLAQRAIDYLGGLQDFGMSELADESSWRMRFIQAYEQLQKRQAEDAMMLPAIAGYIQERRELGGGSVAGLISAAADKMRSGT